MKSLKITITFLLVAICVGCSSSSENSTPEEAPQTATANTPTDVATTTDESATSSAETPQTTQTTPAASNSDVPSGNGTGETENATTSSAESEQKPFKPWTHELTGNPDDQTHPYAYDIAVSADGKRLAVGCVRNGDLFEESFARVIDAETGETVQDLWGPATGVAAVDFTEGGKVVVTGSWDTTFREFDVETGKQLKREKQHDWPILTLAVSRDSEQAVSASDGLRLWNVKSAEVLHRADKLHSNNPYWCVALTSDGKRAIAGCGNGQLAVWNVEADDPAQVIASELGRIKSVDINPDGTRVVIAATDRPEVVILDLESGKEIQRWKAHENGVSTARFSPDGKTILTGSGELLPGGGEFNADLSDHSIRLWNAETGKELKHVGDHELYVTSLAFSPDGLRAYSTSGDGTVRVWDLSASP